MSKALYETFNEIYKEEGVNGVIAEIEDRLEYGEVTYDVANGLYCITTGGWSDDEHLLNQLTYILSVFGHNHYVGQLRGGAYYFSENNQYKEEFDVVKLNDNVNTMYGLFDIKRNIILSLHYTFDNAKDCLKEMGRRGEVIINEYDVDINFYKLQKENCIRRKMKRSKQVTKHD